MRCRVPTAAAAAVLAASVAIPAVADELVFSCAITSLTDISDSQPYVFPIRVDTTRRVILDVDGDGGSEWVTDRFTDAIIEAHFDEPSRIGGLVIDRNSGTIDIISAFRTGQPSVGQWKGSCTPNP